MDNQLLKPEILMQRLILMALAVLLVVFATILGLHWIRGSDPYVKTVLSLPGDPIQGHAIFQMNCAGCHGNRAEGRVGPSLDAISKRKSKISLIEQVIGGKTPPMPQFQPSTQAMADLLSYLEKL
ncbi:MAG: cytochrome c [Cyanosarcina radialis HA8281-LM2]|nr:cytochrome c [Cyanosarcina radialis HA8281-LM2]